MSLNWLEEELSSSEGKSLNSLEGGASDNPLAGHWCCEFPSFSLVVCVSVGLDVFSLHL